MCKLSSAGHFGGLRPPHPPLLLFRARNPIFFFLAEGGFSGTCHAVRVSRARCVDRLDLPRDSYFHRNVAADYRRDGEEGTSIHLMASSATAGAPPAILKLKFIFANHDGVVVEYETEPTTLIKDLKVALVGRWPPGDKDGERDRESGRDRMVDLVIWFSKKSVCFPAISGTLRRL